ncbi:MAG: hypothetical protein RL427_1636 [Bacteroidota bacterium]
MKRIVLYFFIIINCGTISAQHFYLKIIGQNKEETKIIDSISYILSHENIKSIFKENNVVYEKLTRRGYLNCSLLDNGKWNDSTYFFKYAVEKKTNFVHLYSNELNHDNQINDYTLIKDTLTIPYEELENFLYSTTKKLEDDGFSMAKVKLKNIQKKRTHIIAELTIIKDYKRQLNDIVINGYEKFPTSHKKNILRLYRNKTFNQKKLDKLYGDFNKFRFIKQNKYPEILFTKDSTKAYIYLEKAKANTFDGYIGFTNNETKNLVLSGYLDLVLNNILNSGEKFAIYWKSDGLNQKTFNLGIELPYVFNSPIGLKTELNIFKQDSTFQNTRTAINIGYYFNYNTRLYLGYQSTESSDIQNANTTNLSDFNNNFTTTSLEFLEFKNDDILFPEKANLNFKIGIGKRDTKTFSNPQSFVEMNLNYNLYLNSNNILNIKSQNFYLQSGDYIVNELKRFGGINSIRGFNENSLQGNTFNAVLTEYRYILTPSLYVHSIIDYAHLRDNTSNSDENLIGLGIGLGLLTKNGLFNIVYANGSTKEQPAKLSNSIVHVSFKASF